MLHRACEPTHPEPTSPRHSHHACEPTHPESTSQDTLQTSDPNIFISRVPVLNFSGADYTTHVCQP